MPEFTVWIASGSTSISISGSNVSFIDVPSPETLEFECSRRRSAGQAGGVRIQYN